VVFLGYGFKKKGPVEVHTFEGRRLAALTYQDRRVLRGLSLGFSNKQIGHALEISPNTVRWHVARILSEGKFDNRHHAGAWANRHTSKLYEPGALVELDHVPLELDVPLDLLDKAA
jgi:DNA-binding CsgD family transcriptional regulator